MQAAGLQCPKLQIAVAFPDPQTRVFPGTEPSRKTRSPKVLAGALGALGVLAGGQRPEDGS